MQQIAMDCCLGPSGVPLRPKDVLPHTGRSTLARNVDAATPSVRSRTQLWGSTRVQRAPAKGTGAFSLSCASSWTMLPRPGLFNGSTLSLLQ